jgi:2-oxoisovalerate dehydrogenase E1 component
MLRGAFAMAIEDGRVVIFLEPIALYHEKDLHRVGDAGWLFAYPPPPSHLLPGEVAIYEPDGAAATDRADLLLVSYANGLRLSLQAQAILAQDDGIRARVVDLRWLNPLPSEAIREQADLADSVLVVDECRATGGGVADAIVADLAERRSPAGLRSLRAVDSFVPLGTAAAAVLVGLDAILAAARAAVPQASR